MMFILLKVAGVLGLLILGIISYVMYFSKMDADDFESPKELFLGLIPFGMIVMFYIEKYKELKKDEELYKKREE